MTSSSSSSSMTPFKNPAFDKDEDVITLYKLQCSVLGVRNARIVSPPNYQPLEVWTVWESCEDPENKSILLERGVVTKNRMWMEIEKKWEDNRKYRNHTYSPDCTLSAYVSESIQCGDYRDVIQIYSVRFNKAIISVVLVNQDLHGPVIINEKQRMMKFSPDNRKLLYFAYPREDQVETGEAEQRDFLMCIYDFDTEKVSIVCDVDVCTREVDFMEWTPDSRGVVFQRDRELLLHEFGYDEHARIMEEARPTGVKFSPDGSRLAIFLTDDPESPHGSTIVFYNWPLTRDAKQRSIGLRPYFIASVPERPWANDGKQLILNTYQDTECRVVVIDVEAMTMHAMPMSRPVTVVDVRGDQMLLEAKALNTISSLWISAITLDPSTAKTGEVFLLTSQKPETEGLWNFNIAEYRYRHLRNSVVVAYPMVSYGETLPMLVIPHHDGDCPSFTLNNRDPIVSTFALLGFCVVVVNYREPFAMVAGEHTPLFTDYSCVETTHRAVEQVLDMYGPLIDRKNIHLWGEKFGAFTAGTIIAKYPSFYKRCLLVRPRLEAPRNGISARNGAELPRSDWLRPLRDADRIRTPVLIIIERNGLVYPYEKFEQTLLANKVPVKRVSYEKYEFEPHVANAFFFFRRMSTRERLEAEAAAKNK